MSNHHDFLRRHVQPRFDPLVVLLAKRRIAAHHVTMAGLVLSVASAPFILLGWLVTGGWLFAAGGLLDALDGPLARRSATDSAYGSILDSTADRIGEGVVLIAIMVYVSLQVNVMAVALCGVTLLASQTTSYLRAVAASKGIGCTVGMVTRVERVVLLSVGLILEQLVPVLALLALTCSITVLQRFLHIRRALRAGSAVPQQPVG